MKLGLISDVHAQLHALESAISVLEKQGVDRILCAGDLVEKGAEGDAVVATLRAHLIASVKGNHDENAVAHAQRPHFDLADPEPSLTEDTIAYLDGLPEKLEYRWADRFVTVSHGLRYEAARFKREVRTIARGFLVLGHTHRPTKVRYRDLWIVNPGSVCGVRARDSATCATLRLPDGRFELFSIDGSLLYSGGADDELRGAK